MKITLYGNIPSKKNSKRWTGKYLVSSKNYLQWEEDQLWLLKSYNNLEALKTENNLSISCTFYRWDKRKFDLSNSFESVADLLVKAGIISDDNMEILSSIELKWGWYDKENPRVTIKII